MSSVNKVILVGRLGGDPERRSLPSGAVVTNIRLATSETRKNKATGQNTEQTEWHRVVLFDRLADLAAQYLSAGSQVYIEGRLHTRKWQAQDGSDRYQTEIVTDAMQFLGARKSELGTGAYDRSAPTRVSSKDDSFDEKDIPF